MDFFNEIGKVRGSEDHILWSLRNSLLYIHTANLIDIWIEKALDDGKDFHSLSRDGIRNTIADTPGFISHRVCKRIGNSVYRCSLFNINKVPESVKKTLKIK